MKIYKLHRRLYGKRNYEVESCCEVEATSISEAKMKFIDKGFYGEFIIYGYVNDKPFKSNYTVTLK